MDNIGHANTLPFDLSRAIDPLHNDGDDEFIKIKPDHKQVSTSALKHGKKESTDVTIGNVSFIPATRKERNMQVQNSACVACVCIDTRIGTISTPGGEKPVFILELYAEGINELLIKFFNCTSKTKGCYTVRHNSDFAKLYRLTLGVNPTKRFSRSQQLLRHFLESRFYAKYETATYKSGVSYLKVTHLEAEIPVLSSTWTDTGTLKKACKQRTFKPEKKGDDEVKSRRQVGDKEVKNRRQVGDDETLQASYSLGLDSVFNPTKTLPIQGKTTNTQDHVLCEPKIIHYYRRENETMDEYYDRVIDESSFV